MKQEEKGFVPPYSSSFVQRQCRILQQRSGENVKSKSKTSQVDILESRSANAGGSFSVTNCDTRKLHASQRMFGWLDQITQVCWIIIM